MEQILKGGVVEKKKNSSSVQVRKLIPKNCMAVLRLLSLTLENSFSFASRKQ